MTNRKSRLQNQTTSTYLERARASMQYIQLKIPAIIRNQKVQIETDVADNANLLLFSKLFMKKNQHEVNFQRRSDQH